MRACFPLVTAGWQPPGMEAITTIGGTFGLACV